MIRSGSRPYRLPIAERNLLALPSGYRSGERAAATAASMADGLAPRHDSFADKLCAGIIPPAGLYGCNAARLGRGEGPDTATAVFSKAFIGCPRPRSRGIRRS